MSDDIPPLDQLLSYRALGRGLRPEDVGGEFMLIRRALEAEGPAGKGPPTAEDFAAVGRGSGTHLLKLVSSRVPSEQAVLRIVPQGANRHPELIPSIDAKKSRIAKIVYRPLEVDGAPTRTLADHILNPDEHLSPRLTEGFAFAFGSEALDALEKALRAPLTLVTRLPTEEFPVVFLPRPGGGDIQATPLSPARAYLNMRELVGRLLGASPPRGDWHRQHVSNHPQNISGALGKQRIRFLARMPRLFDRRHAELYRYAQGGRFPRWRADDVKKVEQAMSGYAELLERSESYSNRDIREGLDRRADGMIRAARAFIDDIVSETRAEHPEATLIESPSVTSLLLPPREPRQGFDRARRVLTSDHFKERLGRAREA